MTLLFLDLETFSERPLPKCGPFVYAEDCEILLFAYAVDDAPARIWDVTEDPLIPEDLEKSINDPETIFVAHNSGFDRVVLANKIPVMADVKRWHDTMVQAYAHALPGGLEAIGKVYNLPEDEAKDKEGRKLVNLFCKPRPKNMKLRRATRYTHPEEWQRFKRYAMMDVMAMRTLYNKMPRINYPDNPKELALWHLDQKINNRGFLADTELAQGAIRAVERAQEKLKEKTADLTKGALKSTTQRDATLKYILDYYGVDLPNLQGATLERRLADPDLPDGVKELLRIRLQASTSSTAKYKTLLNGVSKDGRVRGTIQFCGAGRTGRFSGRRFQPQNLPRPDMNYIMIEQGITAIKKDFEDLVFDDVMNLTSNTIRGCVVAPTGMKLCISDLSNIEGRDQAWIADERWKLEAFTAFDEGRGQDLYVLAYSKMFGVTPESVIENKKAGGNWRQIGKVSELAGGYQGGVGSFVTFALAYNVDLDDLALKATPMIPQRILEEATGMWDWACKKKKTFGLEKPVYVALDSLKRQWREAHPQITAFWDALESNARGAIKYKDTRKVGPLTIKGSKMWLRIVLPSGRSLCYPLPQVAESGQISYMGINQYTRKWSRIKSYGGKFFENVCQAVARDVMTDNMPAIEDAGYEIVLSVHDELITQTPACDSFTARGLSDMLAKRTSWAPGMPLAAGGFEASCYRKEA